MQAPLGQLQTSLTIGNLFVALTHVFQLLVSLLAVILTAALIAAVCGSVGRFAYPIQQRKNVSSRCIWLLHPDSLSRLQSRQCSTLQVVVESLSLFRANQFVAHPARVMSQALVVYLTKVTHCVSSC